MRIISKFKDYYDYLVGKYGEDPILIFDRRNNILLPTGIQQGYLSKLPAPPAEWQKEFGACVFTCELYIGNWHTWLFNTGQRVYTSDDIQKFVKRRTGNRYGVNVVQFQDGNEYALPQHNSAYLSPDSFQTRLKQRDTYRYLNDILPYKPAPILLIYQNNWRKSLYSIESDTRFIVNPQLSTLGIYIDADFVWQTIVQYLSDLKSEKEIRSEAPDKDKIVNKGFDTKTSFRPKMKK